MGELRNEIPGWEGSQGPFPAPGTRPQGAGKAVSRPGALANRSRL